MKQYKALIKLLEEEGSLAWNVLGKFEFRKKSRSFLRKLSKDIGLIDLKIGFNMSGDGSSAYSTLIGMWDDNKGIYIYIDDNTFLYRTASNMKDYTGGSNHYIWNADSKDYSITYEKILEKILDLKS